MSGLYIDRKTKREFQSWEFLSFFLNRLIPLVDIRMLFHLFMKSGEEGEK